jgi:predicted Zn-dependent protease
MPSILVSMVAVSIPVSRALWPLLILVCANASVAQNATSQHVYELLQARDYAEAESAADAALAASAHDCSLRTMLGLAQRGLGKLEPAYATLLLTEQECPKFLPALEGSAELAYTLHKPEAKELLQQILLIRPEDPTTHAMLGALEARSGNCAGSVEEYAVAWTQVQHNASALREYARCLVVLDRKPEAVDALSRLLSLEEVPGNRIALARAESDAGRRSDALVTLKPLLAPESQNDEAFLLGAQIAEADGNTPEAVAWLRQAIQIAPRQVSNYMYFAEVAFNHGSFQVGIDILNLGLEQLPGNARLLIARGVLEVQMAALDAALRDFEQAHRLDPKLSFADDALGMLFSQKHDTSAALAWFAEKSKQRPADPLLQYLYAEALSESAETNPQDFAKAVAAARQALALEPAYEPAHDLLCLLLQRAGDLAGVIAQANAATKLDPYDESALYQEMVAERKLKHTEQTQALLKRLQEARAHNQAAGSGYTLHESGAGGDAAAKSSQ